MHIEKRKQRAKKGFILTVGGFLIRQTYTYIRGTKTIPLYKSTRSKEDFFAKRPIKIRLLGVKTNSRESSIRIETQNKETREIEFSEKEKYEELSQKETHKIAFSSPKKTTEESVIIQLSNGKTFSLNPQSIVLVGKNESIIITGEINQENIKIKKFVEGYENEKKKNILTTQGNNLLNNPLIDKRTKKTLLLLYNLNPEKYSKNITNYNNLKQELNIEKITTQKQQAIKNKETKNDLSKEVQEGFYETQIFQRIQTAKKRRTQF